MEDRIQKQLISHYIIMAPLLFYATTKTQIDLAKNNKLLGTDIIKNSTEVQLITPVILQTMQKESNRNNIGTVKLQEPFLKYSGTESVMYALQVGMLTLC